MPRLPSLEVLWHLLPAGVVLVPTVITVCDGTRSAGERWAVAGLAAGLAVWHGVFFARRAPGRWALVGYWAGVVVVSALLAGYAGVFVVLLYGFYPLAFVTLDLWGLVPMVVLTAVVSWRVGHWTDDRGLLSDTGLLSLGGTVGLALVIAVVVRAVRMQNRELRTALDELARTRAELSETARRTGVLEERQRLSRELHDTVAQGFTSIVTHLEAAEQALDAAPARAREHVDIARGTAREGLGELRRTVRALRPDLLDGVPLGQALRTAADRWTGLHATVARVEITGAPVDLHPDTELALLRVAQEALTNVARHAGASRAVITLSYLGDVVTLDVDDDGAGFDPDTPVDGLGLVGMRERITAVGGRLDVETVPGEGTTIAASVPA
ncbi:sensor histidine kinase [Actinokineospora enzanensis]|uniref:sensor histidine kinase n=1 Tax=Actinokineospora enzanensis TaxID=155975 RepID=UPI000372F2A8|nr:sensor histidine kinase [Actinokineospora enzanensis]